MKQLSAKQKIIYILVAAIVLAGISVMCTVGFNLGLAYSNNKRIDVYIGKDFELNDIKNIAEEVFENKVILQTAKILDDYVAITVNDATDEQVESLKTKIGEKYDISEDDRKATTVDIPSTSVIDCIKPYVTPIIITTLIITVYLAIRFIKQNALKVCVKVISGLIIVEAVYFSIIAITRIPFNDIIMPVGLLVYIIATMFLVCGLKKK